MKFGARAHQIVTRCGAWLSRRRHAVRRDQSAHAGEEVMLGQSIVPVPEKVPTDTSSIIVALPTETLLHILHNLGLVDLITCSQVCHRLSAIIKGDIGLQYKMALEEHGMVDNPCHRSLVAERLEKIREYGARIHDTAALSYHDNVQNQGKVEWQGTADGSLAYILRDRHNIAQNLLVHTPPSSVFGIPARQWSLKLSDLGEGVLRGTVDTVQDLAIIAKRVVGSWHIRIHLLSLESGLPHLGAARPTLEPIVVDATDLVPLTYIFYSMRVFGRYAAWVTTPSGRAIGSSEIQVWNWQTGTLVWHRCYSIRSVFTMLDDKHILVASFNSAHLEIYHFDDSSTDPDAPRPQEADQPLVVIELPPLRAGNRVDIPQISSSVVDQDPRLPFHQDLATRTIAIYFTVVDGSMPPTRYTRFIALVPQNTFSSLIENAADTPGISVKWDDWGPQGALLLDFPWVLPGVLLTPFGSVFPVLVHESLNQHGGQVILMDIHRWAARRARHRDRQSAAQYHIGNQAVLFSHAFALGNPLDRERAFAAPVDSKLPCAVYPGPRVSWREGDLVDHVSMTRAGFTITYDRPGVIWQGGMTGFQTYTV